MSETTGDLLPFQDRDRDLEDRLDDLLQYRPEAGWSAVLSSLSEVTQLGSLAASGAVSPAVSPDRVAPATDEAAPTVQDQVQVYQTALCQPLRVIRFATAAEQVAELRLIEPLALATSFNPELIRELAFLAAHSLRLRGIELVVMPAIELAEDLKVPVTCYGSDPYLAGRVATALARGAAGKDRRAGVSLVLDCGESLLAPLTADSGNELREWHERKLEPVAEMVRDGGLRLVLLRELPAAPRPGADLRAELGEEELLLLAEASSVDAATALADALAAEFCLGLLEGQDKVWESIGERELRRRAARILRLKLRLGLYDAAAAPDFAPVERDRLQARLALTSMVLLRNENVLPIAGRSRVQILVSHEMGPAFRDLLSAAFAESNVNARVTQLAAGDRAAGGDPEVLQAQLDGMAETSDLLVWLTPDTVSTDLLIQSTLLASETPLLRIVVGPQIVPDIAVAAGASGLLQLFGPPATSLRLLPAVLEGSRLASGRLAHDAYAPSFTFGTGAAGTSIAYESLTGPTAADTFSVIVLSQIIRNTGQQTVVEVLQLYLRRVDQPDDQLLGFARCVLKPGEAARVRLQLDSTLLAQVDGDGVWRVEPGVVALYVGSRVGAPEARLEIELTGEPRALKQQQRVSTLVSIESLGGDEPD